MALIKCIECGKEFSDRAQSCPNCGCPTEIVLNNTEISPAKKIVAKYDIWGYELVIDTTIDKYITLLKIIRQTRNIFLSNAEQLYNQFNNADNLMELFPEYFSELLQEMIKHAIGTLNSSGIYDVDSTLFLEKYSSTIDASYLMEPIVNRYFEILNMEKTAKEYREYLRQARLHRWSGGGFGIRGAIKGYFKAQLLNAGTAFLHSLPDSINHEQNLAEISKAKTILFKDDKTKTSVINAFLKIYDSCYFAIMNELISAGKIEKCPFDTEKASRIINNINNFMIADNWDETKIENHLLEAFKADPSIDSVIEMMLSLNHKDNTGLKKYAIKYGFIETNKFNDVATKDKSTPHNPKKDIKSEKISIEKKTIKKEIKPLDENTKKILLRNQIRSYRRSLSVNSFHTIGLRNDGTIITTQSRYTGYINYDELRKWESMVSKWEDIVSIVHSYEHIVGLKADGTVLAAGNNCNDCCKVDTWNNIISIAVGTFHTVGLKTDGTVVAVGKNINGQCDVKKWKNIVAIYANGDKTIGIKSDGTVIATGDNHCGCLDVSNWSNIVSIAIGTNYTFGLKADGTIVSTKYKSNHNNYSMISIDTVTKWKNIISIDSSGGDHIVALKSDGKVLANGCNREGQCDINNWVDILEVYAYDNYTIGLRKNGTLISTDFKKAAKEFALANNGECDVEKWGNIRILPEFLTLDELFAFEKQRSKKLQIEYKNRAIRRSQGVCQYCGGSLKGFLTKKCVDCGKEKDY